MRLPDEGADHGDEQEREVDLLAAEHGGLYPREVLGLVVSDGEDKMRRIQTRAFASTRMHTILITLSHACAHRRRPTRLWDFQVG